MTEVSPAGKVFEQVVDAALTSEEDRTKTVEGRGATIITTSTSMLTLIFGATVILTGKDYTLKNHYAIVLLAIALVAFVSAAVLALILQTFGFKYRVISTATLDELVKDANWARTEDDARRMWVNRQVQTIKTVRDNNNRKAALVIWALGLEVSAIFLLLLSLGFELYTRLWRGPNMHAAADFIAQISCWGWPFEL
jgi:hypothetical protein